MDTGVVNGCDQPFRAIYRGYVPVITGSCTFARSTSWGDIQLGSWRMLGLVSRAVSISGVFPCFDGSGSCSSDAMLQMDVVQHAKADVTISQCIDSRPATINNQGCQGPRICCGQQRKQVEPCIN